MGCKPGALLPVVCTPSHCSVSRVEGNKLQSSRDDLHRVCNSGVSEISCNLIEIWEDQDRGLKGPNVLGKEIVSLSPPEAVLSQQILIEHLPKCQVLFLG